MIRALIIDDSLSSIGLLKWLINQHCPHISQIETANNVKSGLELIKAFAPDILFLDIQMPHQSGFDLLNQLDNWDFELIFTTAYNEFAIQAIRFSALDYLLKPVDSTELVNAIERFRVKRIYAPAGEELYKNFVQNISNKSRKLALRGVTDIEYVNLDEIIRLQAERNYTRIYFGEGKEFLSSKTLKEYEEMLQESGFIRVHRAHLVNKDFIKKYEREGQLLLSDGTEVEVSRRKKEFIMEMFKI